MKKILLFCLFSMVLTLQAEEETSNRTLSTLGKYTLYGLSGVSGAVSIPMGALTCYATFQLIEEMYNNYKAGRKSIDWSGSYAPSSSVMMLLLSSASALWTAIPLGLSSVCYKLAQKL